MTPMVHQSQFTARKVPVIAAEWIDEFTRGLTLAMVSVDRFSLTGTKGAEGIVGQARLTGDLFRDHPPTKVYASLPSELFEDAKSEPGRLAREAAALGLHARWVRRCDLWPTERSEAIVAALIAIDDTLFIRVESSGAKREIANFAGTDWNSYALLVWVLTQHLDGPTVTRWSDDVERTGRDVFSVEQIIEAHKERGKTLQFGDRKADPQDPNDRTLLALLSTLGQADNERRAVKMAGHHVAQLERGGVPLSEAQLPHGVFHLRETVRHGLVERQQVVRRDGMVQPYFDPRYREVIETAVRMHADGDPYVTIGLKLAELGVERRGQKTPDQPTFADILEAETLSQAARRVRLAEATKAFFTVATHEDGDWISDPDHPAFDQRQARLYTGKLELWRYGSYPTKVEVNQLTGRGRTVKGRQLIYNNDHVTTGWLLTEGRWFVDDHGNGTLPIELPEDVWEASKRRLLTERGQRSKTGGAAHVRACQRLFSFEDWFDGDVDLQDPDTLAQGYQYTLTARDTHGRKNFILRRREAAAATRTTKKRRLRPRGWVNGEGTHLSTINSGELARWLGHETLLATVEVLDDLVPLSLSTPSSSLPDHDDGHARLLAERTCTAAELEDAEDELVGAEMERNRAEGRLQRATEEERAALDESCARARSTVDEATGKRDRLRQGLATLDQRLAGDMEGTDSSAPSAASETPDPAEPVDVADLAWWVAGLLRRPDGMGSEHLAAVTQERTTSWRFTPDPDTGGVLVSCTLRWPLQDGHEFVRHLTGLIDDLKSRAGRSKGAAAWAVGVQGQDLDTYIQATPRSSRRQTVIDVLAWLRDRGIPRDTARQTLVDHPFAAARRCVFGDCAGTRPAVPDQLQAWSDHMVATYRDPECPASRSAAIRHDLAAAHQLMAGLAELGLTGDAVTSRLTALREASLSGAGLGQLLRAFRWLDADGTTLRALACPHQDCEARWATVLVPLPEVVVTGYGVLCPDCRRVPHPDFADLRFPTEYVTTRLTRTDGDASLHAQRQTVTMSEVSPAALTRAQPGISTREVAERTGMSRSWVRKMASQLGLTPTRAGSRGAVVWSEQQVGLITGAARRDTHALDSADLGPAAAREDD